MANMMTPTGVVGAAVVTFSALLVNQYVTAQQEAAQEAQKHADALANLSSQLDGVTGRLTQKGLLEALQQLSGYQNINLTGDPIANIPALGEKIGIPRSMTGKSISDPSALAEVNRIGEAKIKEALLSPGNMYSENIGGLRDKLNAAGFTVDDLAAAIGGGNTDAVKRYEEINPSGRGGLGVVSLSDIVQGYDTKLPGDVGDTPGLSQSGVDAANVVKGLNEAARNYRQGSDQQRADVSAVIGKSRLNDAGQGFFSPLGAKEVSGIPGRPGYAIVNVDVDLADIQKNFPDLYKKLQDGGASFDALDKGTQITLDPDVAKQYVEGFAAGGRIAGPGTGTSDSILARLSDGEFVVNAAATRQNLPLLEQINGGGVPGFAEGGRVRIQLKGPAKTTGVFGGGIGPNAIKTPTIAPTAVTGKVRADKQTVVPSNKFNPFTAVGKGLGVIPGYNQTSMGSTKISTENSAWNTMRTPQPSKNITGKVKSGVPEKLTYPEFLQQVTENVLGKPIAKPGGVAPAADPVKPSSPVSAPVSAPKPAASSPVSSSPSGGVSAPLAAESGFSGGTPFVGTGKAPGPVNPVAELPSNLIVNAAIAPVVAQLGGSYGLPLRSAINYGQPGFPSWVYNLGGQFGMLASTYSGHQEGSGLNRGIDWAPEGVMWNTPQGAERMTRFAKYLASLGIMEQVIYQNPFTGETVGVFDGKPVGPGTDMPGYYRDNWAGHQDHIHTRTSIPIPDPQTLAQFGLMGGSLPYTSLVAPGSGLPYASIIPSGTSPSNMTMAKTPGGVLIPQVTYGGGGSSGGTAPADSGGFELDLGPLGKIKLPSLEQIGKNYIKMVSDSWSNIIENLVKNAGQITMGFLGSFFGLDFSPITGAMNSLLGDAGGGFKQLFDPESQDEASDPAANLPADATVGAALQSAAYNQLPPSLQQIYLAELQKNQQNASDPMGTLRRVVENAEQYMADYGVDASQIPLPYQSSSQSAAALSAAYDPSKGAEQWRPVVQAVLNNVAQRYGITNLKAWEDDIIGQINLESRGNPNVDNLNDSDGKGGTQQVFGLGQFLPETFAKHNRTGGDIRDR
jgi:hypothetical protein